jgi:branched-chain amino acid transport system ATP-binding protein
LIFRAEQITVQYSGVAAVQQATFAVAEAEVVTLIGANGAGKTSILSAISGLVPIQSGEMWFVDHRIDRLKSHVIARMGIIQVPEGRRLFPNLTVKENLTMGAYSINEKGKIEEAEKKIWDLFPILYDKKKQRAKTLSGGQQQMLAIGRALMGTPKLMLLDEPSLGLSPLLVQELAKILIQINQEAKIPIILVEQNASMALRVAHRGYVMEVGRIIVDGSREELLQNKVVKEAYLGG